MEMSGDVAQNKIRHGISNATQPLTAGSSQSFCVAIPILYYEYFLR
jgi:hypothetical protein